MFLRSLTLKGFKSFADATTLQLEPGVTVVVGPNGSGKSNVVDAIAWVLGAQAPSSVRSQKMDDVIFAGTAKRAALGRAEVASRSTTRPASCRSSSPRSPSPGSCSDGGERVRHQRRAVPPAGHPGAAVGHRRGPPAARHRQPGPDRRRPQRPSRGPAPDHRGGRGRPQVPQAQGEGRAPTRRPPRPTCSACRTCCARCVASSDRSSVRPRRPGATASSSAS